MREELNNYSEVSLTERFKRLRPPQLWKARFPLLPTIAILAALQIAAFFLLFWLLGHLGHRHNSTVTTKPGVVDAPPQLK